MFLRVIFLTHLTGQIQRLPGQQTLLGMTTKWQIFTFLCSPFYNTYSTWAGLRFGLLFWFVRSQNRFLGSWNTSKSFRGRWWWLWHLLSNWQKSSSKHLKTLTSRYVHETYSQVSYIMSDEAGLPIEPENDPFGFSNASELKHTTLSATFMVMYNWILIHFSCLSRMMRGLTNQLMD